VKTYHRLSRFSPISKLPAGGDTVGMNAAQLSRGLGWFSIGLGLTELLAPRELARTIGLSESHDRVIRALGAREIASGLGLLARPKPTGFAWSRVAGDIMDLSLLGAAYSQLNSQPVSVSRSQDDDRRRLTAAIITVAAVTVVDVVVSAQLTQKPKTDPRWRFTPPGGRSGLRRPIEVDRPQYLSVEEQQSQRRRNDGLDERYFKQAEDLENTNPGEQIETAPGRSEGDHRN
jgi:hypothetical protein